MTLMTTAVATPGSKPALRFPLTTQAFKNDPFPTLEAMREAGPVIRVQIPLFGKVWMATTFDAVSELLRDHSRFLMNPAAAGHRWMGTLMRWLPRSLQPLSTQMLIRDEPDHRRLRSLVDQAFQRHTVEAMRPRLAQLCTAALDEFERRASASPSGTDLIEHFSRPFPLSVICELLGLPDEDRPRFTQWAHGFSRASSVLGIVLGLRGVSKMMRYLREEIQRQARHPRPGLLSAMIQAEEAGDRLSEDELLAMAFLLLAAGHETTLHQISGSVLDLLDHPEQLALLQGDWGLVEPAVQELLRHVSFAQVGKPRYACEDLEFYGQPIRRGQMLFASLASANSDPDRFPEPEKLDLRRSAKGHLAFGSGIHYCLGAKLASVETEIALHQIFTRFPRLRLAVPRNTLRYLSRFGTRALAALPVAIS